MPGVRIHLEGFDKLRRELQLAKPHIQERVRQTVQLHTKRVTIQAQARAPKRTGELSSTIRDEYTRDGLGGFVKAGYGTLERKSRALTDKGRAKFQKLRERRQARKLKFLEARRSRVALANADLGVYAPVVNWGDPKRHMRPTHFLTTPFEAARPGIITDMTKALNATVEEIGD